MNRIFGRRPDPDEAAARAKEARNVREGIGNAFRVLRGQPREAPRQKQCPNGHFAAMEAQVCPFCGYQF